MPLFKPFNFEFKDSFMLSYDVPFKYALIIGLEIDYGYLIGLR